MSRAALAVLAALAGGCEWPTPIPGATPVGRQPTPALSLTETTITIPQVDYEPALFRTGADPYPHLDLARVDRDRVVEKHHVAVVLENAYVRLTLLPEMGRVYSLISAATGHEQLWRNDIVTVGGARNATGWWLWIGGIEHTLPGDEHGTTWALPWSWEVLEDSPLRTRVRMRVVEPKTGLEETLDVGLAADRAAFETAVRIANPTDRTVDYAHWINPMWAPGGRNELTDHTELVIPTDRVVIDARWQANLGPSPQAWADSPLRFITGWPGMGDVMADGLHHGFYAAYSHDEDEGIVRVFDPEATPGVVAWTYGHHPDRIPMGSGAPNDGYVEMWGGTSRTFPDERRPLAPGAAVGWTEWMYAVHGIRGLTFADADLALNVQSVPADRTLIVALCPVGGWSGLVEIWRADQLEAGATDRGAPLRQWTVTASPLEPFLERVRLDEIGLDPATLRLRVGSDADGWRVVSPQARSAALEGVVP